MLLETGKWKEALAIAEHLISIETTAVVRITALVVIGSIKMRKGEDDALPFLKEARALASEAMEAQRIMPVTKASLEYEWITGNAILEEKEFDAQVELLKNAGYNCEYNSFLFWHWKARNRTVESGEVPESYRTDTEKLAKKSALIWKKLGCPYEEALLLFEGDEEDKRDALKIVQDLGADAVGEKLKLSMRSSGIKSIPRGKRKSTLSNTAMLTQREVAIVELLKNGLQNKEIADKLYISPKTVDHHVSSILFKLEVNSRSKAAPEAIRLGIIK